MSRFRTMRRVVPIVLFVVVTAAPAPASGNEAFFGMGFMVRKAPSELDNLTVLRRDPYVARTVESQQALFDHDVGFRWRAGLELGPSFLVALDTGFGVTALPDGPQMSASFRQGSAATVLGVAGLRGNVSSARLGVELAGGFRHLTYCVGESIDVHDAYTGFQRVAEARVRGEQWLGPWAVLGATLGTSLIDRGAWVGALEVTFHFRPRAGSGR